MITLGLIIYITLHVPQTHIHYIFRIFLTINQMKKRIIYNHISRLSSITFVRLSLAFPFGSKARTPNDNMYGPENRRK